MYKIEDIIDKIHCADCLEFMRGMPDKCVDAVVTDPPYGIRLPQKSNNFGIATNHSRRASSQSWDDVFPDETYWNEVFRISKNQIVFGANCGWENFRSSQCYLIWDKRVDMPEVPFAPTEFMWTSFDKMSKIYRITNHGFIRDGNDLRLHPTQKPLKLMEMILNDFSDTEQIICDPFCGSGSTLIAAKQLGRHFIGIEISEQYCTIARQRLAQEEIF